MKVNRDWLLALEISVFIILTYLFVDPDFHTWDLVQSILDVIKL